MSTTIGVLRVLSPQADAGLPPQGAVLPERNLVFPVTQATTTLGRGLHNAVVLFDPTISREHACLHHDDQGWEIENLSATSVILVGEAKVPHGAVLSVAPGQTLSIGAIKMQLVAPLPRKTVGGVTNSNPADSFSSSSLLLRPGTMLRLTLNSYIRGWRRLWFFGLGLIFTVALALAALGLTTLLSHRAPNDGATLLAALTFPLIPVVGVLILVTLIDRYEREPWYILLGAFLWGALIAIPLARAIEPPIISVIGHISTNWPRLYDDLLSSSLRGLTAGIVEEVLKDAGLIVLMLMLRHRFENVTDGILYGVVIGAGFGMVENIYYFASPDSRNSLVFLFIGRILLGWLSHSTFTACFGAALGLISERSPRGPIWHVPALGFVVGVALHSVFDFVIFQAITAVNDSPDPIVNIVALLAIIADYIPLFAAQAVLYIMLMRSLAREAAVLRSFLADEVRLGVVTPEEYIVLQHASVRQRIDRALLLGRGFTLWQATRRLFMAEVGLAFTLWHSTLRLPEVGADDIPPQAYRLRIRHLRRHIARYEAETNHLPRETTHLPQHLAR